MPDTAIQIEHLSKMYRLGVINNGVLFRDIQTWIALKSGKEDLHSKIEIFVVGDAEFQKKALGNMQDLSTGEGRTVLL